MAKITQIAPYVNEALKQTLGETAVTTEDLSNIVDLGTDIQNASLLDTFNKNMINQIGRYIFVDRPYDGIAPSVLVDGSAYGSAVAKMSTTLYDAEADQSWTMKDGDSVDPNVFHQKEVKTKIWNSFNPYQFTRSIYKDQLKQSLTGPEMMNQFWSMMTTQLQNSATVALDNTIRTTVNNFIGETLHSEVASGTDYAGRTGVKAVNLLYLYNTKFGTSLTADACMTNPEFIRFAIFVKNLIQDRMAGMKTIYNIGEQPRFTPRSRMKTILLGQFADAAEVFLYNGTGQFKDDKLQLGSFDKVDSWQGCGTGFDVDLGFNEASKIDVTTASGAKVTATGVVGVIFDEEALGVYNKQEKITSGYNPAGDFFNEFWKYRAMYWNDFNENFVVLYVA
jgi:hypothetical protein